MGQQQKVDVNQEGKGQLKLGEFGKEDGWKTSKIGLFQWPLMKLRKSIFNSLGTSTTKWSNTLKQFVGNSRQIVWVCLTNLWVCAYTFKIRKASIFCKTNSFLFLSHGMTFQRTSFNNGLSWLRHFPVNFLKFEI